MGNNELNVINSEQEILENKITPNNVFKLSYSNEGYCTSKSVSLCLKKGSSVPCSHETAIQAQIPSGYRPSHWDAIISITKIVFQYRCFQKISL